MRYGPRGVVLAHASDEDFCSWLPYARQLAASGHRVLAFDSAPGVRVDLEIAAAVEAMRRTGSDLVIAGGASIGATGALIGSASLPSQPAAVVSLSAPASSGPLRALRAVRRLHAPVFFAASEEDQPYANDAREMYAATPSSDPRLEIRPGAVHGERMLDDPAFRAKGHGFHRSALDRFREMAQVLPAEGDLRRVIGDGEGVPDGEVEGLSQDDLLELHRRLVLLRTYDERSVVYHRQGRIGTYAIFWGHEAMQVGGTYALEDADWIFPSYRESAIGLLRGMPASTVLSWWRGHPTGWWNPADWNVASICVPIGTHVPHAAGLAWGKKLRGERTCAIAFFGDGATSEGAFHEGANFAAVMRAPVVLFCNNNQWAISTPLSAQTAAETLADKAAGYGIPGVRVDGGDVLAVYEATREAVERARAGDGPTLIEAVTYRCAPHATADDPTAYIDAERVEEERQRECVGRYEAYLRRLGLLSDEAAEAVRADAAQLMRDGIAAAEAEPPADPELLFSHAFADPPASFESDLAELRRVLGG